MTSQNTFTNSMEEYFGITKTATGGVEIFTDVVVEDKLTVQGVTGCYINAQTGINSSYIDFGSTIGGGTGAYDSRIISFNAGGPSEPNNLAFQTDGTVQILGPLLIGSPIAPAFKLDYGRVGPIPGTVNPQSPVVFTVGLFTTSPYVFLTVVSPIVGEVNSQDVHVESLTPAGCNIDFIGVPNSTAPGTFCNWLAIGL